MVSLAVCQHYSDLAPEDSHQLLRDTGASLASTRLAAGGWIVSPPTSKRQSAGESSTLMSHVHLGQPVSEPWVLSLVSAVTLLFCSFKAPGAVLPVRGALAVS